MRLVSVRGEHAPVLGVQAGDRWLAAADLLAGGPSTMDELVHGGRAAVDALRAAIDPKRIAAEGRPVAGAELRDPPILLADGDVVEVAIERVGTLRNTCRHERVAGSLPERAGAAT